MQSVVQIKYPNSAAPLRRQIVLLRDAHALAVLTCTASDPALRAPNTLPSRSLAGVTAKLLRFNQCTYAVVRQYFKEQRMLNPSVDDMHGFHAASCGIEG